MPRATTERFSRVHQPALKKDAKQASASMTNPIFNTQRFGQHILKNPATAQKSVNKQLLENAAKTWK
jgi:18S rRNA (adenine1779-N6/adenine1780-N6)-dimethyltransferase